MLDKKLPTMQTRKKKLVMIVPDHQFKAGVSVCDLLEENQIKMMCFPESHRELALSWQAKMRRAEERELKRGWLTTQLRLVISGG